MNCCTAIPYLGLAFTHAKKETKMSITDAQLAAKRSQLDAEAAEVDALLSEVVSQKSYSGLSDLEARVNQISADRAELDRQDARAKAVANHPLNQ